MSKQKLKLEVGKRYVLRNGQITGPLQLRDGDFSSYFPFKCSVLGHSWKPYGEYDGYGHCSSPEDIVAEYVETTAAPQLTDEQVVARFNELVKNGRIQFYHEAEADERDPAYRSTGGWVGCHLGRGYRLKPAEPRRLKLPDSGYECEISADGKEVKVGCRKFLSGKLASDLEQLFHYGGFVSDNGYGRLFATREGIRHDGPSSHTITWNDADALLKFLTEKK